MDLSTLTDEEVADNIGALLNEQERRQRLALIPAQVADLATRYEQDGGDPAVLRSALDPAPPAP